MNATQIKLIMRWGVTEDQAEACGRCAERWVELQRRYRVSASPAFMVALQLASWHVNREPIAFTILEAFDDANFAHDLSAVYINDEYCSLRSAREYHKGRD